MGIIKNTVLKVCKIDSITFASFALKQNVDFLGVHVLESSNVGDHKELIDFIKSKNGKPIVVTKIQDIGELKKLIAYYKPAGIQFHFEIQPQLAAAIHKLHPDLKLFGVITDQSTSLDFSLINELYNFIIYDASYRGGTNSGSAYVHLSKFPQDLKDKTLLAGGINLERIEELRSTDTTGFDIQSYFRTDSGLSFRNLEKVCDLLKFPRKNMISVSLTDIPLASMHRAASYHLNSNLEYHLDFSPGSLYPSFNTIEKSIGEKQKFMLQLPYSLHLFIQNESELKELVKTEAKKNPLSLVRIFVQYFDGISREIFSDKFGDVKIIPSVFFKDIESFFSRSIDSKVLSVIVPLPGENDAINAFVDTILPYKNLLRDKELWLDRNLEPDYIQLLKYRLNMDFNVIVGKSVINDWSKLDFIHEHVLK